MLRGLAWQTVIVSMQQSNHGMLQKHYSMQQDLLDPGATLSGHIKHIKSKSTAVHQFSTDVAAPALL